MVASESTQERRDGPSEYIHFMKIRLEVTSAEEDLLIAKEPSDVSDHCISPLSGESSRFCVGACASFLTDVERVPRRHGLLAARDDGYPSFSGEHGVSTCAPGLHW